MNDIILYDSLNKSPDALEKLGMVIGRSGSFGFGKVEQGVTMMAICVTERMTPLQFMRTFHVMPNGSFSKKAGAALAEFEAMGGEFEWLDSGDGAVDKEENRKATGKFKSKSGRKIEYSYSISDATREGLVKPDSRWKKRPGSMLRARVITNALGMIEPSIFFGENDESDATSLSTLNLAEAAKEAKPIEATVVASEPVSKVAPKEDEPELAKAGLAPVSAATGTEAPFKPATDANGLTLKTVAKLAEVFGDKSEAVIKWLAEAQRITNNDIRTLSLTRAAQMIKNPKGFIAHAGL